jgi:lipoprotein-releasing system ATP-binding protein
MNTIPLIKAKNLTKTFYSAEPLEVLKGVSFEVFSGETVAIMGKSGEGKSTLLHILGTLEKPSSGQLEICGLDALSSPSSTLRNTHIGFIFQTYNLLEDYTTLENVLMPAKIARLKIDEKSESYHRALALLEHVGLSRKLHQRTKSLSGGEKQRAAIARALMNTPDLILADEPSGSLDRFHSLAIHDLLLKSVKSANAALILVTHDDELAGLCDHQYYLREGMLIKKP